MNENEMQQQENSLIDDVCYTIIHLMNDNKKVNFFPVMFSFESEDVSGQFFVKKIEMHIKSRIKPGATVFYKSMDRDQVKRKLLDIVEREKDKLVFHMLDCELHEHLREEGLLDCE